MSKNYCIGELLMNEWLFESDVYYTGSSLTFHSKNNKKDSLTNKTNTSCDLFFLSDSHWHIEYSCFLTSKIYTPVTLFLLNFNPVFWKESAWDDCPNKYNNDLCDCGNNICRRNDGERIDPNICTRQGGKKWRKKNNCWWQ